MSKKSKPEMTAESDDEILATMPPSLEGESLEPVQPSPPLTSGAFISEGRKAPPFTPPPPGSNVVVIPERTVPLREFMAGETFPQFCQRHGGNAVRVRDHNTGEQKNNWLLPDGASAYGTGAEMRSEPPTDPAELLKMLIQYKFNQTVEVGLRYADIQKYIASQAKFHHLGAGPAPDEAAFVDLQNAKDRIRVLKDELEVLRAQLRDLAGPDAWDQKQQGREEDKATARNALERMNAITGESEEDQRERLDGIQKLAVMRRKLETRDRVLSDLALANAVRRTNPK